MDNLVASLQTLPEIITLAINEKFWIVMAVVATLAAFVTLAIGQIFASTFRPAKKNSIWQEEIESWLRGDEGVDIEKIDFEDVTRLDDLRAVQLRYQRQVKRSALSFNFLVAGQFIVGALLASTYIQTALEPKYTGLLGVLVLLSSAVQQRFRPDVLAAQARSRLTRCNRLIRILENGIFFIQVSATPRRAVISLRKFATKGLDGLDIDELTGLEDYHLKRLSEDIAVDLQLLDSQPDRTRKDYLQHTGELDSREVHDQTAGSVRV